MKTFMVACGLLLLGCTLSDAARPFDGPVQLFSGDGPRRQLQALNKTQATAILKVVADLAGEVKSLGLGSELDEAVNKVALAEFLVSSLAGLGVLSTNINSVLVGGKLGTSASQATSNSPVIKSVVQALQTLLDQGSVTKALTRVLKALSGGGSSGGDFSLGFVKGFSQLLDFKTVFKRIGLPLNSAKLKMVVNVDRADRVLVRLVATTINDYVKLANAQATTSNGTGSKPSAQASATTKALAGKVATLMG